MKRFSFLLAMLALGLAFVGCNSEVEDDPLNGTYVWDNAEIILDNGKWTAKQDGIEVQKGTYTVNEGTIKLITSDIYFNQENASYFNTTVGWKNRSQATEILRAAGMDDVAINDILELAAIYSGNTLMLGNDVYTRQ